jgi:Lon protease-like protein
MNDDGKALENFAGIARLFPLPNVVLFPHVIQPLHIFEPRYRQMTADALAGDRLIAPVLLSPGWEADYEGRPETHTILCLGRIVAEQRLPDGRYNLLLRGLSRGRIVEELPPAKLYRSARIELLPDGNAPASAVARPLAEELAVTARPWFPPKAAAEEQLEKLLKGDLPLGVLCDLLSFAVPLTVEIKQELLEVLDVEKRARNLLHHLRSGTPPEPIAAPESGRHFPPDFSSN